jgi:hypothetical protein
MKNILRKSVLDTIPNGQKWGQRPAVITFVTGQEVIFGTGESATQDLSYAGLPGDGIQELQQRQITVNGVIQDIALQSAFYNVNIL